LTLFARQSYLFDKPMVAWGDDAVFGIQIDDAKHLRLLVGANSRIGTSHPGPAFFYVAGASEAVLYDVFNAVPAPLNAQRIGDGILAAVFFAWSVALLALRLKSSEVLIAASTMLAMLTALPFVLASSWLPHAYCMPFMLTVVSAGCLLAGERKAVVPYVIAGWFLVHGHVGFILNVAGMSAFLSGTLTWRHRHELSSFVRRNSRSLVKAGIVSSVFLLPMVINLFANWPTPWREYYDYSRNVQKDPRTASALLKFIGNPLTWQGAVPLWVSVLVGFGVICAVWALPSSPLRQTLTWLLASSAAALICFIGYAVWAVDRLTDYYIAFYVVTIPAVVVAVGAVAVARLLGRQMSVVLAGVAAVLAVVCLVSSDVFVSADRGDPQVAALTTALQQDPQRQGRQVVLSFESGAWPWAVGVMKYGADHQLSVCAADPYWTWFITKRYVCSDAQKAVGWPVHMATPSTMPASLPEPLIDQTTAVAMWPDSGA
jgi:hypothetical protein